jgi:hypothetical protein
VIGWLPVWLLLSAVEGWKGMSHSMRGIACRMLNMLTGLSLSAQHLGMIYARSNAAHEHV